MALATLSIDLVAQLAQLQQGMDKAGRLAAKTASQIEAKFAALSRIGSTIGLSLGGALAGAGLTALIRNTVEGIDKLNDLADATGSSVENLSALEDAARRTGTGVDVVGDALVKLNKTLADAKPGSEQAAALKAIGLSADELKKIDPAEALLKTAQALAGFADDGSKARIVQELFGKSIKDVAPLLKDLVEQGQLNATVTQEQADAADKFRKQSFELENNLKDLARTITSAVVPALNAMFDRVKKEGFFSIFAPSETQQQIEQANNLANSIKVVGDALQRADALSKNVDLPGSARSSWAERAKALRTQLEGLQSQALKVTDAIKGAVVGGKSPRDLLRIDEAASRTRASAPAIAGGAPKEPKRPGVAEFGPFLPPSLSAALKAIDDADETKLRNLREQLAELVRIVSTKAGDVPDSVFANIAEEIAKLDPAAREAGKFAEAVEALADQSRDAQMEKLAKMMALVRAELERGGPEAQKYARALQVLGEQMKGLEDNTIGFSEKLGQLETEVSEFAKEASRNIQDALGDSILQSMEGNAKSIGDIWKNMLKRMVAEAAAANLAELILGKGYGSKTGSLGGWLGTAIGFFTGGAGGSGGGGGGGLSNGVKDAAAGQLGKSGGGNIIVQGDATPKTLKAIRVAMAQSEARSMRRGAY